MSTVLVIYWTGAIVYFIYAAVVLNVKKSQAQDLADNYNAKFSHLYGVTAMLSLLWFLVLPVSLFIKEKK